MIKVSLGVVSGIAFTTLLCACDLSFDYQSIVDRAAIRAARTKWEAEGIKDYAFVYQEHCACNGSEFGEVRVEVRDDHAMQAVGAENGVPYPAAAVTIDQLIGRVLEASKDGADKFSLEFDSERNFLTRVSLDPDSNVRNDEYGFEIACFSPEDTRCAFPLISSKKCTAQQGFAAAIPTDDPESVCSGGAANARGQVERDVSVCCVD